MYRTQCVLACLLLYAGLVHSFSWEFVISYDNRLGFYDINGTQTYTHNNTGTFVRYQATTIINDPVHNRVLFVKFTDILSFEIASKTIKRLIKTRYIATNLAYDPVTDVLFWTDVNTQLHSRSLKPGLNNESEESQLVLYEYGIHDVGVDSCGGFIYWTANYLERGVYNLQRARFNGSDREVVIDQISSSYFKIDQQTQKIYWFDTTMHDNVTFTSYIKCSDLNGKNVRTIHTYRHPKQSVNWLTLSKDSIYLLIGDSFWKIPKNPPWDTDVQPAFVMKHLGNYYTDIAINYSIEDLTRGIQNCEALTNLLSNNTVTNVSSDVSLLCVHGTKVIGESRCECTQGYSGERCDVSLCFNYCLHGDCSASAEGQPECRCNAGYSGNRCEVDLCYGYCLNNGTCSLDDEGEPSCQCVDDHAGTRCGGAPDVARTSTDTSKYYPAVTNLTLADLLSKWRKPKMFIIVDE